MAAGKERERRGPVAITPDGNPAPSASVPLFLPLRPGKLATFGLCMFADSGSLIKMESSTRDPCVWLLSISVLLRRFVPVSTCEGLREVEASSQSSPHASYGRMMLQCAAKVHTVHRWTHKLCPPFGVYELRCCEQPRTGYLNTCFPFW